MILSIVSRYHGIGKSELSNRVRKGFHFFRFSFAGRLRLAASEFIEGKYEKDEVHPYLGVTRRQIVNELEKSLSSLHPDLPVYIVRQKIENLVKQGADVVIDDTRRKSEFVWLDELAKLNNTFHAVIEIVPDPTIAPFPLHASLDTWKNGLEPCGKDAWPIDTSSIFNAGTDDFWNTAFNVIEGLLKEEARVVEEMRKKLTY